MPLQYWRSADADRAGGVHFDLNFCWTRCTRTDCALMLIFAPAFPPGLASEYDVIEVRRTWHFDTAIRLN